MRHVRRFRPGLATKKAPEQDERKNVGPRVLGGGRPRRHNRRLMAHAEEKGQGKYNVVVIGAGTAGLVTAAGTSGLGGRAALIEGHKMGGDCLNFGCVPSKALISSANLIQRMRRSQAFGLQATEPLMARLGVSVTVVELLPRLLPRDDPDAAEIITKRLTEEGVRVLTGSP